MQPGSGIKNGLFPCILERVRNDLVDILEEIEIGSPDRRVREGHFEDVLIVTGGYPLFEIGNALGRGQGDRVMCPLVQQVGVDVDSPVRSDEDCCFEPLVLELFLESQDCRPLVLFLVRGYVR